MARTTVREEQRNYVPTAEKAKAKGARDVYICTDTPWEVAKQIRPILTGNIIGCGVFDQLPAKFAEEPALNGTWFMSEGLTSAFRMKYVERFKGDLMINGAATQYDIINALARLAGQKRTGEEIVKFIRDQGMQRGAHTGYQVTTVNGEQVILPELKVNRITEKGVDRD